MVVSRISMNGASVAAPATSQTLPLGRHVASCRSLTPRSLRGGGFVQTHGRLDRNAQGQWQIRIHAAVYHNLHRHALHDLHEVARGILRRERREARPGAKLDAVDMSLQVKLRISIDTDVHLLPDPHALKR